MEEIARSGYCFNMNYKFDETLAIGYKSGAQKIRRMSEDWVSNNIYCPCCGNPHITKMLNNSPVSDFQCLECGEIFELKSKGGRLGKKIVDGAYDTMISRITSNTNPDLFLLEYSQQLEVINLLLIPKFFFVPSIIEKRTPLASTARRAGWIGCNILINEVPYQGRIHIINDQKIRNKTEILNEYKHIQGLKTNQLEKRGWLFDILNCINKIPTIEFSLGDVYKFAGFLQDKHCLNHNVEAKIRQQLQILRDKNIIEFLGRGHYRKK